MIKAYHKTYLEVVTDKVGLMFEIAVLKKKIDIDEFVDILINSSIIKYIEKANPIYVLGYSANELLGLILDEEPFNEPLAPNLSPEYWTGYVLAYASWYFNKTFSEIIKDIPLSKLILYFFPYHEEDILNTMDLIAKYLDLTPNIKKIRLQQGYSQNDLALLSDVPIRNIRAYEQRTQDISKASAETIYKLAKALNCNMEDLI